MKGAELAIHIVEDINQQAVDNPNKSVDVIVKTVLRETLGDTACPALPDVSYLKATAKYQQTQKKQQSKETKLNVKFPEVKKKPTVKISDIRKKSNEKIAYISVKAGFKTAQNKKTVDDKKAGMKSPEVKKSPGKRAAVKEEPYDMNSGMSVDYYFWICLLVFRKYNIIKDHCMKLYCAFFVMNMYLKFLKFS